MKTTLLTTLSILLVFPCRAQTERAYEAIPVARVWSGHTVGFDLLTTDTYQYAGYYDQDRNMVVAQRRLDSTEWKKTMLPTRVGWDSHNYIEMAVDRDGYLHVAGNMHNVPLIYFRSVRPDDISRFEKLPMTGQREEHVTYPIFLKNKEGKLYFQYRDGGSGNGVTLYKQYDPDTQTWSPLFDAPFFDGEGEASAYMISPSLGPDGYFYTVWMWRQTPVANTCHNISCVRSPDLLRWETLRGQPVTLPIRWRNTAPVAVPLGPWNGLTNMAYTIGWDQRGTPLITYHQYDPAGHSQIYISRWEGGAGSWLSYPISRWPGFTWQLNETGSLKKSIYISPATPAGDDALSVSYDHETYGKGTWLLDRETLVVREEIKGETRSAAEKLPPLSLRRDMEARTKTDNTGRYLMRWQTLPVNQDRPRPDPVPEPTELVVYKLVD